MPSLGGFEWAIVSAVCCCFPAVLAAAGGIFYVMKQRGMKV
jgi:hypothetical protein